VQAYEIQRRLRVWKPKRAAVMGAGTIGLLATLVLRLRGLEVTTFGKTPTPYLNSDLIEAIGATYQWTDELSILDGAKKYGPFDIIFEATGFSPVVFDSMQALGKNGVLVLSSVTGGDCKIEVPADKINLEFVLGNKVMVGTVNANREYFELGVKDLAQAGASLTTAFLLLRFSSLRWPSSESSRDSLTSGCCLCSRRLAPSASQAMLDQGSCRCRRSRTIR
jgi:threonine dehydrogenase-like Zn-dependent dehydrogenase